MAALADVRKGDVFLVGIRCTGAAVDTGLAVNLYGPGRNQMATGQIAPDGTITGSLATTPDQIPVQLVTGFAPIDVGDVMENENTGETLVCRWSEIRPNGSVLWSASASRKVIYRASGWTVVGHLDL